MATARATATATATVGEVYAMAVPGGRFAALQVLADLGDGRVEIATLTGTWEAPPSARQLAKCKVQRQDWGSWQGRPDRTIVDARVPVGATRIATLPIVERFRDECTSYGGWSASAPFWSWRWNVALAKRDRARYTVGVNTTDIEIDLGAGRVPMRRDQWKLRLGGGYGQIPLPSAPTKIRWAALDVFGLTEIDYTGDDPGFLDFVRRQRLLNTVRWRAHGQRAIDLRDTLVTDLALDAGKDGVSVRAPRYLASLTLAGAIERISVDAAHVGAALHVTFDGSQLPKRAVVGLEPIVALEARGLVTADVRRLAPYPRLESLQLRGAPGSITHVGALAKLTRLRELTTHELWDLDGDAFPRMPSLAQVEIVGLRKRAVAALKQKLAGADYVRLANAKTDEWIAANLHHPLRDWSDDDPRFGRAAIAAWNRAAATATKAGRAASMRTAEKTLKAFVTALNKLDGTHGIDTIRREQAAEAFAQLAEKFANLPAKTADGWFDAWRDF